MDVALTTGEVNEGGQLLEQLERIETTTGARVQTVTADKSYAHTANYHGLEERGIDAIIPPQATARPPKHIPGARFKYDAKHRLLHCPGGKKLTRKGYDATAGGWRYCGSAHDCNACALRNRCFTASAKSRIIVLRDGHEALLRARRRKARGWDESATEHYKRHRWRVEGAHGEAKTQHGLRRAARRGLGNVAIQVYLTATVMNLKRLAKMPPRLLRRLTSLVKATLESSRGVDENGCTLWVFFGV